MVTEDYISFGIAKLLKEKGFDGECRDYYDTDGHFYSEDFKSDWNHGGLGTITIFSAPTLQMAMKWLRKIYSLEIYPYHDFPKVGDKWWFEIIKYPNTVSEYESETVYNNYEEACESAIKYCLENLI